MSILVEIPGLLRDLTHGSAEVTAQGTSIEELLAFLDQSLPGFQPRFFNGSGELSNLVNIYVNEVDFHQLSGLSTPLSHGDRVRLAVAPLISGGA